MLKTKRAGSSAIAIGAWALAACTNTDLTPPAAHPASPSAPAGKAMITTALRSDFDPSGVAEKPGAAEHEHHHGHEHGAPAAGEHQHGSAPAAPTEAQDSAAPEVVYTCPMHPEILRKEPGNCPICGMKLVVKKDKKK